MTDLAELLAETLSEFSDEERFMLVRAKKGRWGDRTTKYYTQISLYRSSHQLLQEMTNEISGRLSHRFGLPFDVTASMVVDWLLWRYAQEREQAKAKAVRKSPRRAERAGRRR